MKLEVLREKIETANVAYRSGTPIMSDQAFDDLCDEYQKLVSEDEWNAFRDSLHEKAGKVKHPFIMGSLDKIKYEEPKAVKQFIDNYCPCLIASAKVDGISCRLHYEDGRLVSASTRGNGEFGEDITDKIKFVKCVPQVLGTGNFGDEYKNIDIRGELVILKNDFASMSGFANARNACAGIMNRKDWKAADVSKITFVAYTILGDKFTKEAQFAYLNSWGGFYVAWNKLFRTYEFLHKTADEVAADMFKFASQCFDYETDGLVLCDASYRNEVKYRPDKCKAFKINQLVAETTLIDVNFEGPSKGGLFVPVAVLEPVSLGGAMISRCTLHNMDIIKKLGVKYGSRIKIIRSGDVIPKIIEVINTPKNAVDIKPPTECPICGSTLVLDGVNWQCTNPNCSDKKLHQAVHFIKKLGVKSASEATFKKFGIKDIAGILKFKANSKKKSEKKLADELQAKVFSRSKQELLAAMNIDGLGETLINKIVDFYGYDNIAAGKPYVGLPCGIGEITLQKFKDCILENLKLVDMFINDSRYNYLERSRSTSANIQDNKNGMSVCFTGKLDTMSRSDASKKAEAAGFEVLGGVKKGLTYLVTNTPDSGSSKNRKAKELGTKVIDEQTFLKLCRESNVASDVFSL